MVNIILILVRTNYVFSFFAKKKKNDQFKPAGIADYRHYYSQKREIRVKVCIIFLKMLSLLYLCRRTGVECQHSNRHFSAMRTYTNFHVNIFIFYHFRAV